MGLTNSQYSELVHQKIWYVFAFFLVMQLLSSYIFNKVSIASRDNFTMLILAETVIRLIFCLIFIVIFIFNNEEKIQLLVANFFVLYLCSMIFEIQEKSRKLQRFS